MASCVVPFAYDFCTLGVTRPDDTTVFDAVMSTSVRSAVGLLQKPLQLMETHFLDVFSLLTFLRSN